MAEQTPPTLAAIDLERIVQMDPLAIRDAFRDIHQALNQEITNRYQTLQPLLAAQLTALSAVVNTFANQPTSLGAGDAGLLFYCTDYNHVLRWSGSVWTFAPGDGGNRYFRVGSSTPQELGWQLCDGTVTDSLTVGGAALTVTAFATPAVTDGTFLKRLAAYTGTIDAATMTGKTAAVNDAGATADDMNITSFLAGPGPTIAISNSTFIHKHSPGTLAATPQALGGTLYWRR